MVRTGSARRPDPRSAETRQALVDAAIDVLRTEGFAAATARTIAGRAGCNQGLVFYHFGSVVRLLLAALDEVSARRRGRYEAALESVDKASELVALAGQIFSEDLDSGDAAVLVEMIAGAASTPGLGAAVKERIPPWNDFAMAAIQSALGGSPILQVIEAADLAHAVVALYLGLELLSHLDGDRGPAMALFGRARSLVPVLHLLGSQLKEEI